MKRKDTQVRVKGLTGPFDVVLADPPGRHADAADPEQHQQARVDRHVVGGCLRRLGRGVGVGPRLAIERADVEAADPEQLAE